MFKLRICIIYFENCFLKVPRFYKRISTQIVWNNERNRINYVIIELYTIFIYNDNNIVKRTSSRRPHEQLRVEVGFEQNFCDRVIYIWIDWKTLCVTVLDCWRDCMEKLTRFYWLLAILSKSNCGTSVDRLERSSWPFLQRTDSRCVDRMLIYSLQDQRLILAD